VSWYRNILKHIYSWYNKTYKYCTSSWKIILYWHRGYRDQADSANFLIRLDNFADEVRYFENRSQDLPPQIIGFSCKYKWSFPEQIRELFCTYQGIFVNKLEDFPDQNRNCRWADHKIFLNGSWNFPEQIREISWTSGRVPEHSTVAIWPELVQVECLKFQVFYLISFKCVGVVTFKTRCLFRWLTMHYRIIVVPISMGVGIRGGPRGRHFSKKFTFHLPREKVDSSATFLMTFF